MNCDLKITWIKLTITTNIKTKMDFSPNCNDCYIDNITFFFFLEFHLMIFAHDNNSLSLDQEINR